MIWGYQLSPWCDVLSRERGVPVWQVFKMADKQRFTSGTFRESSQNVDSERSPEQNSDNDGVSRDLPGTSGRIVQAHSDQPDQPLEESPNCPDNQSVAGSSNLNVVNSQGPVQLGAGAAVIHNPTYHNYNNYNNQQHHHHHYHPPPHITSPDQYLQWMEHVKAAALRSSPTHPGLPSCPVSQHLAREEDTTDISQTHRKTPVCSSHRSNSTSFHVPCHCSQCRNYHEREHPPLAEMSGQESQSQNSGQSHHQRLPQLLPSALNTEQEDSTKKGKTHQQNPETHKPCQSSSCPPRPSPGDVRQNVTGTQQQADERKEHTAQTVRSPDEARPGSRESIPDSVCIIDSQGRSLEPGDAVEFQRDGDWRYGIYVGGQEVVWSEETDHLLVYKEQLQLTDPFQKLTVVNGPVRVFPPEERVDRAKSRVGTPFTEGDRRDGSDFYCWIFTGMGGFQAESRGFILGCN